MKQERVVLSFIMVLIGLLVAGLAFYFYQSKDKSMPLTKKVISPTPVYKNDEDIILDIINPENESVVSKKDIKLSGKTNADATIIVITKSDQQIITPSKSGDFTVELTLDNDQNLITIFSILPSGESKKVQNTITYSTSNF